MARGYTPDPERRAAEAGYGPDGMSMSDLLSLAAEVGSEYGIVVDGALFSTAPGLEAEWEIYNGNRCRIWVSDAIRMAPPDVARDMLRVYFQGMTRQPIRYSEGLSDWVRDDDVAADVQVVTLRRTGLEPDAALESRYGQLVADGYAPEVPNLRFAWSRFKPLDENSFRAEYLSRTVRINDDLQGSDVDPAVLDYVLVHAGARIGGYNPMASDPAAARAVADAYPRADEARRGLARRGLSNRKPRRGRRRCSTASLSTSWFRPQSLFAEATLSSMASAPPANGRHAPGARQSH